MTLFLSRLTPRIFFGFLSGIILVAVVVAGIALADCGKAAVLPVSRLFAATLFGLLLFATTFGIERVIRFAVRRNLDNAGMVAGSFVAFVLVEYAFL